MGGIQLYLGLMMKGERGRKRKLEDKREKIHSHKCYSQKKAAKLCTQANTLRNTKEHTVNIFTLSVALSDRQKDIYI